MLSFPESLESQERAHSVEPRMKKPGLQFTHAELGGKDVNVLFDNGTLSREQLERSGFIIIRDYEPSRLYSRSSMVQMETEHSDPTKKKAVRNQWLHRDGKEESPDDLITLYYTGQSDKRGFATLIAVDDDVLYKTVLEFLAEKNVRIADEGVQKALQTIAGEARALIELLKLGVNEQTMHFGIPNESPQTPRDFLFSEAVGDALGNWEHLPELYDKLEEAGCLYRHEWKENDILVLHNSADLLHCRGPSHVSVPSQNDAELLRHSDIHRYTYTWNGSSIKHS